MSTITIIQGNNNDKDNTRAYMVKGESGVSPTVSVERTTGGAIVTTTDYEGTHTAQVNDGVSPTVETSKTAGVTTITITDYEGEHTATINDGETYEVPAGAVIGFDGATVPAGYEEVDNPNNYSTTETKIGTWIDGKPIYRQVISFGALPNATQKRINHNISNIDNIVKIDGLTSDGTAFTSIPLVYKGSDSAYNVEMVVTRTEIICGASEDRSRYTSTYVIIEYTKTTD